MPNPYVWHFVLFGAGLALYASTSVPTVYTFDSAELAIGTHQLGIVHAPGYPLYLMLAHLFAQLPFEVDFAGRVNLFSAFCLAATLPLLYDILVRWQRDPILAAATTLIFGLSYYVWSAAIVAEVYTFQILTLTTLGWILFLPQWGRWWAEWVGIALGLVIAAHSASALFLPAILTVLYHRRVSPRAMAIIGVISLSVWGFSLGYFPWRSAADPTLNLAGEYDAMGQFIAINLHSVDGIWWMVRGAQFESLFFSEGVLPTPQQLITLGGLYLRNYLGIGVLLAGAGLVAMWRDERKLLGLWGIAFVPHSLFFATYAAPDLETMLGAGFLLCSPTIMLGLGWFAQQESRQWRSILSLVIVLGFLILNYPLVNGRGDDSIRLRTELTLAQIPENAYVFGNWFDIVPLQYVVMVDENRQDLALYNNFLFSKRNLNTFFLSLIEDGETVVWLGENPPPRAFGIATERLIPIVDPQDPTLTFGFIIRTEHHK